MSDVKEKKQSPDSHLGSVPSYVAGFILSLLLTIIPYLLVKNQIIESGPLLITVLVLAMVQMFIQMFFFLHLGRGPKPFYNIVFFAATSGMILLVVGASMLIMGNLYRNMSPAEATLKLAQDENIAEISGKKTGACQGNKNDHVVFIGRGIDIEYTRANRCDTLTIKSGDELAHELMFGTPDSPTSYGGVRELSVRSDRAKIITLNEVGDFSFYDQNDPSIMTYFTVTDSEESEQ